MGIGEKLLMIQVELKVPRSQYNSFGRYNYRNCEDILEAVKPLCYRHKAVLTLSDELVCVGTRYYVKATATLLDVENGDKINNTAFAREEEDKKGMDGSQITGASSSYARKYALNGLLAIDDTKDSDTTNKGETPSKAVKQPTINEKQNDEQFTDKTQNTKHEPNESVKKALKLKFTGKDGKTYELGEFSTEMLKSFIVKMTGEAYDELRKGANEIIGWREQNGTV